MKKFTQNQQVKNLTKGQKPLEDWKVQLLQKKAELCQEVYEESVKNSSDFGKVLADYDAYQTAKKAAGKAKRIYVEK